MLPISRFDYELPEELIAQHPIEPRDRSRLLLVDRQQGSLSDHQFIDLPDLLQPGDVLVMNDTRVLPARLFARRTTGGHVELLFLEEVSAGSWQVLARPARRLREGQTLTVLDRDGATTGATVKVARRDSSGTLMVELENVLSILEAYGQMPLPPYIGEKLTDPERYQTVYATNTGSAAAPTAGLHFTDRVLAGCRDRGIVTANLTLHVGLDTFQPVKTDNAREHQMHSEWFAVPPETVEVVRHAKLEGRRVVAVGTTAARTLESIADDLQRAGPLTGSTSIYITPPYRFKVVDAMITNFHLPRTTLILMISALAGEQLIMAAYQHAIRERYRFYSFGDAMLIV